jgi:hypothetical protein
MVRTNVSLRLADFSSSHRVPRRAGGGPSILFAINRAHSGVGSKRFCNAAANRRSTSEMP